jgi:hypothetical protein
LTVMRSQRITLISLGQAAEQPVVASPKKAAGVAQP